MRYLKKTWKYFLFCLLMFIAFNAYFIFLMHENDSSYLLYIDLLLGICLVTFTIFDLIKYKKDQTDREELMQEENLIYQQIRDGEEKEIAEHDCRILQERLQMMYEENCDLQDYIAKWCHELKIPLATSMLLDEKIKDVVVRSTMREQLERMKQQLNAMLLGCRLQGPLFDLQVRSVELLPCVRESVRNNQFFLIQKGFEIDIRIGKETVYTDASWLTYILDQLLNNAIKYAGEHPKISVWCEKKKDKVKLFVQDQGEGIQKTDIRRIFEKGYTGNSHHNGKYKSTGMGLYMVSKIITKLGHEIEVESNPGEFTRFTITFCENDYYQLS